MQHVWYGTEVKRAGSGFKFKKNARTVLVRKEGSKIISECAALFASRIKEKLQ